MKNRLTGILALLVLFSGAAALRADDADVQKELQTSYDRMNKAFKEKDLKALLAFYAPDYQGKTLDGQTTDRAAVEARLKGLMESVKSIKTFTAKIDKITVKADEATVAVTQMLAATIAGPDGKEHTVDLTVTGRAVWVKSADGWRLRRSEALSEKGTVDGEPVDRKANP